MSQALNGEDYEPAYQTYVGASWAAAAEDAVAFLESLGYRGGDVHDNLQKLAVELRHAVDMGKMLRELRDSTPRSGAAQGPHTGGLGG